MANRNWRFRRTVTLVTTRRLTVQDVVNGKFSIFLIINFSTITVPYLIWAGGRRLSSYMSRNSIVTDVHIEMRSFAPQLLQTEITGMHL